MGHSSTEKPGGEAETSCQFGADVQVGYAGLAAHIRTPPDGPILSQWLFFGSSLI